MWQQSKGVDLTSAFRDVTVPLNELMDEIHGRGWEPDISFKEDQYAAVGKNPHGESLEGTGPTEASAAANLLVKIMRRETIRGAGIRIAQWDTNFSNQIDVIAQAYANAPVYDPNAAPAWRALAEDSTRRAATIKEQLQVEVVTDPEPYATPQEMCEDVHKNKHFFVSSSNSQHPVWTVEENVDFRIVHDVLGHCFTPDTMVRTENGYRPIIEIREGDRVVSSDGTLNRIKTVWTKHFEGNLVKVTNRVGSAPIRMTPEHEVLSLEHSHQRSHHAAPCSPSKCGRAKRDPERFHSFAWKQAQDLSEKSYVVTGALRETEDIEIIVVPEQYRGTRATRKGPTEYLLDEEFLWIIGLFLAEGSTDRTKISFGLHAEEREFQNRVVKFFENHGFKTNFATRPKGDLGVKLEVYGTTLATWWKDWLGHGCDNKAIPSELMNLPEHRLSHIIDGVMDGDGWKTRDGITQTSSMLARQLTEYGLRTGLMVSTTRSDPIGKKPVYGTFGLRDATRCGVNKRGFWNLHGQLLARNQTVEREAYNGWVFDLEVENDPSYIVENVVVHNCVSGGDFGWEGENRACGAHFPLLTPLAQKALFTECIGQTAAAAYYRSFMQQKVAFLDEFLDPAQEQENPANHQGLHPSQSLAPTQMPQVQPSTPQGLPWATQIPNEDFSGGIPVFGSTMRDPNSSWESGVDAMPNNAYLWHGDPLQAQEVSDNAMKIDTQWSQKDYDTMKQAVVNAFRSVLLSPRKDLRWNTIHYQDLMHVPASVDDPKRYWDALEERRVGWNTARGFHPDSHKSYFKELNEFKRYVISTNPDLEPWDAEEKANQEFMHMWNEEEDRITSDPSNSDLSADEVDRKVAKEITKRLKAITKPEHEEADWGHEQISLVASIQDIEEVDMNRANEDSFPEGLRKELQYRRPWQVIDGQTYVGPYGSTHSEMKLPSRSNYPEIEGYIVHPDSPGSNIDAGSGLKGAIGTYKDRLEDRPYVQKLIDYLGGDPYFHDTIYDDGEFGKFSSGTQFDLEGNEAGKYGAFMGTHLKAIAQLSKHIDEITKAALEDVKEHDGSGHHFRSTVLELNVPGVGPKVCSFAWLLLQPATSQLATIDVHMMDVLGHNYEKEMNDRNYFKFERELAAGRDAAGYNHIPLGQFQWGMWDYKRTGPGSHQDHSGLKVLNPTPHNEIDWAQKAAPAPTEDRWDVPQWWGDTEPARQQVADDWDQNIATHFQKDRIPHIANTPVSIPWILWEDQVWIGQPGDTFMNLARTNLGLSMEEVWAKLPEPEFSAGVYDSHSQRVFPQDEIDQSQQRLLQERLGLLQ